MKYTEYREKIKDVEPPKEMEIHIAIMWLHPETLPVGIVTIGDKDLEVVKIPEEIENKYNNIVPVIGISNIAFAGNEKITDIVLPATIDKFPSRAFAGCTNLRNITIPRNIKLIKEGTFAGCNKLENVFYEGTPEDWKQIEIVNAKHEVEFGSLTPGTPVQSIVNERDVHIPGNEALFSANIHYRCELATKDMTFKITSQGKDITDYFRVKSGQ